MSRTRTFRHRRSRIAIAIVGTLALGGALLASNAVANLTGSSFEGNDGNLIVNTAGNTDWANATGVNTGTDKPSGSTDNSFGQGTKEDSTAPTVVNGSIPPNKNDLTRFYETSSLGSNGHTYLQLAWERAVNTGNANLDFEINQNVTANFTSSTTGQVTLNRTAGDMLITYDFGGSGAPALGLNTWVTSGASSQCVSSSSLPCWGNHVDLTGVAEGAVNSVPVTDPLRTGSPTLGVGLFGEASIDLTAANIFPAGTCEAFGSTFVKSRSSTSFSAEVKDFIAPVGVSISNCASITIHKVTQNGDSSFGYTTTGSLTPAAFSLSNGGHQDYAGVAQGSYSVTENLTTAQVAAGWTLASLTCTASGTGTSATTSGSTINITATLGGSVDCTYTNHINLSPTISTTLSASPVTLGDSMHDSATLTGATAHAGGTVTYHAYAGANTCTGTDLLDDPVNHTNTVTVTDGSVPDSPSFTATSAGTYSFQAVYSGDGNNNSATSTCSSEQLVVNPVQPGGSTAQNLIPNDSFTLTGATSGAGGTVSFKLFDPSDPTCSGTTPAYSESVNVSGNGSYPTTNTAFVASTTGTWRWLVVYSGDTNNLPVTSTCGTEQFTISNS